MNRINSSMPFVSLLAVFAVAMLACGVPDGPDGDPANPDPTAAAAGTPGTPGVGHKRSALAGGWPTTDAQEVVLLSVNTPYVTHCAGTQISAHWILTSALCIPQTADTITVRVRYSQPGSGTFQQVYPPGAAQGVQYGTAHVYRIGYFWQPESAFALLRLEGAGTGMTVYPAAFTRWTATRSAWYYVAGYGATIEPPSKMMGLLWSQNFGGAWWGAMGPTDTHVFDNGAPWFIWTQSGRRVIVAMTSAAYSSSSLTIASPIGGGILKNWIANISRGTPHPLSCYVYGDTPLDYYVCYE